MIYVHANSARADENDFFFVTLEEQLSFKNVQLNAKSGFVISCLPDERLQGLSSEENHTD